MTSQVPTVDGMMSVGLDHHRHGIPAHVSTKTLLNFEIAWRTLFLIGLNGVDVARIRREGHINAFLPSML